MADGTGLDAGVRLRIPSGDVSIAVTDLGGSGPPLLLLHGLAGSSRELLNTAAALMGTHSFM